MLAVWIASMILVYVAGSKRREASTLRSPQSLERWLNAHRLDRDWSYSLERVSQDGFRGAMKFATRYLVPMPINQNVGLAQTRRAVVVGSCRQS
jgi:hypothetical protein